MDAMVTGFIFFCLRTIICAALYGSLLMVGSNKPALWRQSLYVGIILNGTSGFGYLAPRLIPGPDAIGMIGNTLMCVGWCISYIKNTPAKDPALRRGIVRDLSLFFVVSLLCGVISYYGYHQYQDAFEARREAREAKQAAFEVKADTTREVAIRESLDSLTDVSDSRTLQLNRVESKLDRLMTRQDKFDKDIEELRRWLRKGENRPFYFVPPINRNRQTGKGVPASAVKPFVPQKPETGKERRKREKSAMLTDSTGRDYVVF